MPNEGVTTIPIGWITSAGTALLGAIGWLAREILRRQKSTEKKLEACEDKHETTQTVLMEVREEMGVLRGRQEGVSDLAKQVLEVVRETKEGGDG